MPFYEKANLKVITCVQKYKITRAFYDTDGYYLIFFSLSVTLLVYFGL